MAVSMRAMPGVKLPEDERPRTWRARLAALRYLPKLLRLVWQTHRAYTTAMIALRLLRGIVPVAALWTAKLIIDQVVLLARTPGASRTTLWRVVALELGIVGASDKTAKEVQMLGIPGWLSDRYASPAQRSYDENKALSVRKSVVRALLSLLGTLGYYAAYATILIGAVAGAISLGTLTFLAAAFSRSRDLIQRLLLSASDIYEQSLYLKDLFVFLEMEPAIRSKPGARPVPIRIESGFVFEDVGFQYPGSERWAIRHVNLAIAPGERLALVGENGAGKMTITKLLARLYDPSEGRILLDGMDLREYDLASLRQAIGVIFQDFVRYDMRFDENVGVGEIDGVAEYFARVREAEAQSVAEPPAGIVTAAERSLASSLLPRFTGGFLQNVRGGASCGAANPADKVAKADRSPAATISPAHRLFHRP